MSQNQLEIYVRSSPLGDVGIHWRNITKPEQPKEEPDILKRRIIHKEDGKEVTVNFLINDVKPSIILARYHGKVLLEVTGINATENRSKQLGRRITEVVLWVGDASSVEAEIHLRELAACALISFWNKETTFTTTIREAVNFDGLDGFRTNLEKIEQLYVDAASVLDSFLLTSSTSVVDTGNSIWSTPETVSSDEQLIFLANQLSKNSLPDNDEPVVVIAEFKENLSEHQLVYKGNVWVASPAHKPIEQVVPLPTEKPQSELQKKTSTQLPTLPPRHTGRIAIYAVTLLTLLVVVVVVAIWLVA